MNPGRELLPGRELDALVAEEVMRWPAFAPAALKHIGLHVYYDHGPRTWSIYRCCICCGRDDETTTCLPPFSTEIAAAWTVVEKLCPPDNAEEFFSLFYRAGSGDWVASFGCGPDGKDRPQNADTASMAICLAALKAVGAI